MADKKFGVKQINLIGASGTPTLTSPNNLNINAINVAISTDLSVGGDVSIGGTFNALSVSGVSTFTNNVKFIPTGLAANKTMSWDYTTGELDFADDSKIVLGNEFAMRHSSASDETYFHGFGNRPINIGGSIVNIQDALFFKTSAKFDTDASAELYYDGSKKFETIGAGVTVTGTTNVSGNVSVGGTISVDGGVTLATNNATVVGTSGSTGDIKQIGGAPFFYDGSAWREFVLSTGTPVTERADTEWDTVAFRLTGENGFEDEKFNVIPYSVGTATTTVGSPVRIGTESFRVVGPGIGLSYSYRSEYDLSGSFTIEFWLYEDQNLTGSSAVYMANLIGLYDEATPDNSVSLALRRDSSNNYYFYWVNGNLTSDYLTLWSGTATDWNNTAYQRWVHIALVRESSDGSLHFYLNGVESSTTYPGTVIDNNINCSGDLIIGDNVGWTISGGNINVSTYFDGYLDDIRISAGVGTFGQRYTSVGVGTTATFAHPETQLPITGTTTTVTLPPKNKSGVITLGASPSWRGTSGVTVTQQSAGNYRLTFTTSYDSFDDYYALPQAMDQGFASYVGVARSTTHVDFSINRQSNDATVDTGSLAVQIVNNI